MNDDLIDQMTQAIQTAVPDSTDIVFEDVTAKHHKHAQYIPGKRHFNLSLNSQALAGDSKLCAHRTIYQALTPWIETKVHALTIRIVSGKHS